MLQSRLQITQNVKWQKESINVIDTEIWEYIKFIPLNLKRKKENVLNLNFPFACNSYLKEKTLLDLLQNKNNFYDKRKMKKQT